MWSVQQQQAPTAATIQAVITGASTFTELSCDSVDRFDETGKWDCLLVSLDDHFNDGWGTAELVVDVPRNSL